MVDLGTFWWRKAMKLRQQLRDVRRLLLTHNEKVDIDLIQRFDEITER